MKNNTAQPWSRTTGASLTSEQSTNAMGGPVMVPVVGRKFRIPKHPQGGKDKRTEDTFTILALDHNLSNPNSFTFAQIKNDNTGHVFWNRIQHNNGYMVPLNQK